MRTHLAKTLLRITVAASLLGAATGRADDAPPPPAPVMPKIPAPADVGKPPADAEKHAFGLVSKVLQKGTGTAHPTEDNKVEVNYVGWQQRDGFMFDTSQKRGTTFTFPLAKAIKGWREGLKLMVVGEKRRLWIPADIAYGNEPRGPGKAYGDLCFDVELVAIHPGDAPEKPAKGGKKKAH
ncbi:MAG TPA: FKBP-type peptidyl-prolyl cis-trans isomerase [Pseudomonadota bacterium]|nr:FKBP-type peptidyl-prolyl cis-trans isomerase [Pseudomonadota bacterium]